jgi:hypothetical protein
MQSCEDTAGVFGPAVSLSEDLDGDQDRKEVAKSGAHQHA